MMMKTIGGECRVRHNTHTDSRGELFVSQVEPGHSFIHQNPTASNLSSLRVTKHKQSFFFSTLVIVLNIDVAQFLSLTLSNLGLGTSRN